MKKVPLVLILSILLTGVISAGFTYDVSKSPQDVTITINEGSGSGAADGNASSICAVADHVLLGNGSCMDVDDIGGGGGGNLSATNGPYLSDDGSTVSFDETLLNATIDHRAGSSSQDGNASSICSSDQVLLGNGSCMAVTDITPNSASLDGNASSICANGEYLDGSGACINFNATVDLRDSDTTYTAGANLSLVGTVFSLNATSLKNWLDTLYAAIGSFFNSTDFQSAFDSNITSYLVGNTTYTDTDTNASSVCSGDEVLLGNSSCMNSTYITPGGSADGNDGDFNFTDYQSSFDLNITVYMVGNKTYTDTNESTRVSNLVGNCSASQQVWGFNTDGTKVCVADATGAGGKDTSGPYIYNSSTTIYINSTKLNATIDARDTDTDTNASTICSGDEVLLGNSSCMNSTYITPGGAADGNDGDFNFTDFDASWTINKTAWENKVNASFLSTYNATYAAQSSCNTSGSCSGGDVAYMDYANTGNFNASGNISAGTGTMRLDIYYNDSDMVFDTQKNNAYFMDNVTASYYFGDGSQLTNLPGGSNWFDQQLNTTNNVQFKNLTIAETITFALGEVIDNIINGIIQITGHLYVTGAINATDWSNVTITESQITDLSHTTDTNASIVCSGDEVMLGNASCMNVTDITPGGAQDGNDGDFNFTDYQGSFDINITSYMVNNATYVSTYNATYAAHTEFPGWDSNLVWTNETNIFTENQNLSSNNITDTDCIVFASGGKICSGT